MTADPPLHEVRGLERTDTGRSLEQADWFKYELWRQPPASFNVDAVKAQVVRAIQAHHSA